MIAIEDNLVRAIEDNLERFFQNERTVLLPIDHGIAIPVPGLEDPGALIEDVYPHVDGFVVNEGLLRLYPDFLDGKGICFRTDIYKPSRPGGPDHGSFQIYDSHDAVEAGAHMVMNMCYPHHANEASIFRDCADLVAQRRETGLPVILESLPYGIGRPADYTVENIGYAVRAAGELGADIVKTAFPTGASTDDFRKIIQASLAPVVVLGGAAMQNDEAVLTMVEQAMGAGAAGVAIGRNVWQHPKPGSMARAIHAIVHLDATAREALEMLD